MDSCDVTYARARRMTSLGTPASDRPSNVLVPRPVSSISTRPYIASRFSALLNDKDFRDALPGHLPGDANSQARRFSLSRSISYELPYPATAYAF